MMKTLLFSLLTLLVSATIYAQQPIDLEPISTVRLTKPPVSIAKAVADTLAPDVLTDPCAETVTIYGITEEIPGYVLGSNALGTLSILQRIQANSNAPFLVTSISVAFADYDDEISNTSVRAVVYDDLGADGSFGSFLGGSESIQVDDIVLPPTGQIALTTFNFSTPVLVQTDSSFLIGIDFADTYTSNEEGYIGLFSTQDGCGSGTNTFETYEENGNTLYSSIANSYSFTDPNTQQTDNIDIELVVFVTIETDINTSTHSPTADYHASVQPNPTTGNALFKFVAGSMPRTYSASLTDLAGKVLRQQKIEGRSGTQQLEWDLSDLSTGLYLYHIDGPEGRQSGKVIKQ
ncbi:T9SS type A sorting domain-containing protein [Lewinella sp. IMCC34183]|uniref:T9SS type A sorting domain-containing protein n=1 Tax=Lewinella sp. IMCC34183 TaxID=2248762 RepID=UPI000E22FBEE|nr:T9SS type A sorting domain-containing protein [Lewinella sp. IMCC34183]